MARIDSFIQAFARWGAQGAVMASDEKVTLRYPQGNRFASQGTPHAELVAMVEEIAPAGSKMTTGGRSTFGYRLDGKTYDVRVEAAEGAWTVTILPQDGDGAGATAQPPLKEHKTEPGKRARESTHLARIKPVLTAGARKASAHARPAAESAPSGMIERLLRRTVELRASDLHLTTGSPPMVRIAGQMGALPGYSTLNADDLLRWLHELTPEKNRSEFEERSDTDFAHTIPGVSRFRVNLFRDRHGPGAVFRAIPFEIVPTDRLGIPPRVLDLCSLAKGFVAVTGPTGSGKSTTLAALVDHMNQTRSDHIITIEDPIEFIHENKKCLVNQREIHSHTRSFKDALRAALREDPDIVLVGEMRDLETVEIAVETAETGHLVFGTLHTTTAPSTVDRIIDQFPGDRQDQIRQMLSESLRGVISQTLCRKVGGGRVAAFEILIGTPAVANLIRERKTFQLFSVMQTGKGVGMITLNDSLYDLVKRGLVEPREAYLKSANRPELKTMLQRDGLAVGLGD